MDRNEKPDIHRTEQGVLNRSFDETYQVLAVEQLVYNPTTNTLDRATIDTPTAIYNGKKTVTTAGTRVALATTQSVKSVTIKALNANTGTIYVGNSTVASTNGLELLAGDTVSFDMADLATIYLDSSVNGEGVTYLGVL